MNSNFSKLKGFAWMMQILSGAALVFLLTFHILLTHIYGKLDLKDVLNRVHDLKIFYLFFIIFVVFHAFNGLSTIAYEYNKRLLSKILYLVMLFVVVYGIVLLILL